MLATGRRGVIAFEGAYHGLGYGALNATHRNFFRNPFHFQLREFGHFVPFPAPSDLATVEWSIRRQLFRREHIGAILVEPVQGRGGIKVPPAEFLPLLRKLCDEHGALLILDEIYTGFGRTGKWFACEHTGVTPDLICLGKALTGGFPALGLRRPRRPDGCRVAGVARRGDSHQHLPRPSRRLRHGAGANPGN
jgi:acetylornithine/succinyldiaminopimelate/putrescine aminotransferase